MGLVPVAFIQSSENQRPFVLLDRFDKVMATGFGGSGGFGVADFSVGVSVSCAAFVPAATGCSGRELGVPAFIRPPGRGRRA